MKNAQHGFTYLGLLFAVALGGVVLATAGTLWSTEAKREREAELLFAGDQIRAAIASYQAQAPAGQPHAFPRSLSDLLDDKRWPTKRRHLRKVYVDPMTRSTEWGLIEAPGGGIVGVYSRSEAAPLKRALFPERYSAFEEAGTYRGWRFVHDAQPGTARN